MGNQQKKWLLVATVLTALSLGGYYWADHLIKETISEKLAAKNILQYEKLKVSLIRGGISFISAEIDHGTEGRRVTLQSPKIAFKGIRWLDLLWSKELVIDAFRIDAPVVKVYEQPSSDCPSATDTTGADGLMGIRIGQVILNSGSFFFFKNGQAERPKIEIAGVDLELKGLHKTLADGGRPVILADAHGSFRNLSLRTESGLHNVTADEIVFSQEDSLLEISGLQVMPQFDERSFFKQLKFKKSRLDFRFPHIRAIGWDFGQVKEQALAARRVDVPGMNLHVLTNQNYPVDPARYKPLPHEALAKAPLKIKIDTIVADGGRLVYEMINEGKTEAGQLVFAPLSGVFSNVTNDSSRIAQNHVLEVKTVGYINGRHPVSNRFWMDLSSPDHVFSFKGEVGRMPFSGLNAFLKPCADVSFDSGTIEKMEFTADADKFTARGQLDMEYEELGLTILDEEKKERKLLSKVVHLLFVRENNDTDAPDYQVGNMFARRDTTRSFFSFWWSAIQSGIQSSVLNKKKPLKKNS